MSWLMLLLLSPSPSPSQPPPESGCPQAISADNAQALYAAIKDFHGADGCKLEEMRTEKDVMRVEWKKDGVSAPLVEIRPLACGRGTTANGAEFSMSAPAGAVVECPAAVEKMRSLIESERFGGAVRLDPNSAVATRRMLIPIVVGAGALVLAAGVIFWLLRRRKRG